VFDAGRRAVPIFVKANKLDAGKIAWTAMDPPLRETMLVRGDVDAITGFYFTSLLNLNARGVKDEDVDVMMYPKYGVNLYGNAIIVSEQFLKEKPEVVKAFLRAFTRGMKDVLADPDGSIRYVKERDALVDEALEKRRMKLAIDSVVATPTAKADGLGGVQPARLADMVTQVSSAFELKSPVTPEQVFNAGFLPAKADRMVFPK
jgi:NitT/TauT family transport system substrate-binding protein